MSDKAYLSRTGNFKLKHLDDGEELIEGRVQFEGGVGSSESRCVFLTSRLRATFFEFVLISFHLIKRQQSGSASLHAYYYVYIQHMHYLHIKNQNP